MQLRNALGLDPKHEYTNEEIDQIKNKFVKYRTLNKRLKGNGKNSFSTTIFDKDNNIIETEPYNPEFKIAPEESTTSTHYDESNTFNILNRYSTNFLRQLFNQVAQKDKKDPTRYAKSGMKVPKLQNAWSVLPEYMQHEEFDPN